MTNKADVVALLLRVVVAAVFVAQGAVKTFAAADAPHGRLASANLVRARRLPHPELLARLLGASELGCGILVGLGLLTRPATVPLVAILVLAIVLFKWKSGFIAGWDWPFAVLGAVLAVLVLGGGAFSVDALVGWPY